MFKYKGTSQILLKKKKTITMVTFKERCDKLYYTQYHFLNNVRESNVFLRDWFVPKHILRLWFFFFPFINL